MPDKFDTLIDDLQRVRAAAHRSPVFGEQAHQFWLEPTLSEEEVAAFELQHKVRLPEDYRQFLLRAGNGGAGPYYGLFKLGEMDDGFEHGPWGDFVGILSSPFPHSSSWNDLTKEPVDHGNEADYWRQMEEFEKIYFDAAVTNGAIPICHLGCALRQWLVITGPERDNVWCDNRADHGGLFPLQQKGQERVTFFEWYRFWLDDVVAKIDGGRSGR